MLQDINYLVLSDIHLGRKNNPTKRIISNLIRYFKKYHNKFKKLDMIFINGDVYDRLLTHGSEEAVEATLYLNWLARYCLEHDIVLRILEGTPSHDWKQIRAFQKHISDSNEFKSLDFKYIEELSIEHISKFNIDILYVPDEWRATTTETLIEVHKLLKDNSLEKVSLTMMHGNFKYQLPKIAKLDGHSEEDYLKITEHYIHIGHVHKFSTYGRILANGSFDRLAHGEEEDKGGILSTIECSGRREYIFLPNEQSYIFDTIDGEQDIVKIKKLLRKRYGLTTIANIRLRSYDGVSNSTVIKDLQISFPRLLFTSDVVAKVVVKEEEVFKEINDVVELNSSNITPAILKRIDNIQITPILLKELKSVI